MPSTVYRKIANIIMYYNDETWKKHRENLGYDTVSRSAFGPFGPGWEVEVRTNAGICEQLRGPLFLIP